MVTAAESSSYRAASQIESPMSKAMTIVGMVVAGLIGLVFALDLAVGIPFNKASYVMDVGGVVAAGVLGYLSWDALREIR